MARKNSLFSWIEDMIDDTKDLVDDLLDRAKDLEDDARDAVKDAVSDDESSEIADLRDGIAALTAQVNQLVGAK